MDVGKVCGALMVDLNHSRREALKRILCTPLPPLPQWSCFSQARVTQAGPKKAAKKATKKTKKGGRHY